MQPLAPGLLRAVGSALVDQRPEGPSDLLHLSQQLRVHGDWLRRGFLDGLRDAGDIAGGGVVDLVGLRLLHRG